MPHTLSYCALIGKCALIRSNTVINLTTHFLGKLRHLKWLTSTTALLESVEGETKECDRTGYQTRDLWLLSQMSYGLPYMSNVPDGSLV